MSYNPKSAIQNLKLFHCLDDLLRRLSHSFRGNNRQAGIGENFSADLDISPLHPDNQRHANLQFPRRLDNALRKYVTAHDTAEDVNEHAAHARVSQEDAERLSDLFLVGASANVEEIRRFAAAEFDNIHGRHCQSRAVDHTGDIAVQRDIGKIVLARLDFTRIFFVEITQGKNLFLPKESVAVEIHFGVER